MIVIKDLQTFNFEEVAIDPFWNNSQDREMKIHRIHSYPAKFPSFITTKALDFWETKKSNKPGRVADIFCGCGTTAFEVSSNKINFWGCDINPVATLIAKVKSHKYQSKRLEDYYKDILDRYEAENSDDYFLSAPNRLKYWFSQCQYNDLAHLRSVIFTVTPEKSYYRLFFLCALSNILKPASRWLTKSIKPQIDPNKKSQKVIDIFKVQFKMMHSANQETKRLSTAKPTIVTGDFLDDSLDIPLIDMIITSPPYVTSYEYADLHQLSSLWLEYASDYRDLRKDTIGSLYHQYNFEREIKRLNSTGRETVNQLLDQHRSKARSVAKYFLDMQNVVRKTFSILNPDGIALFIIGNTEYKNVRINNAKHLAESLFSAGFSSVSVTRRKISKKILTPYRDVYGKFTKNPSGRKVYSEEYIIVGNKRS